MIESERHVRKYLRWIADNHIVEAGWRRDGRPAFGHPEDWNQHRLASRDSSITVPADVHSAAMQFVAVGPLDGSMFVLNTAGEAFLRGAET
ncbi:hypothetical protein [Aureimonas sp. AU40]|uniref:hypothetical protein n=1 Tax=Aureimonas sp. AU40 TaxID=1637747 RepID=UPI0012E37918|nr:hypothetical protein [Aureimonas sp. AU40]